MVSNGDRKIRYAVVRLGWIAQAELGKEYNVDDVISYKEYDDFLKRDQVDAVYIALSYHGDMKLTVNRGEKQDEQSFQPVKLEPFDVPNRPDERQKIELRAVKPPEVVEAESPTGKQ